MKEGRLLEVKKQLELEKRNARNGKKVKQIK